MTQGCSLSRQERVQVIKPIKHEITCDIELVNNPKSTTEDMQNCLITYIILYNSN